MEQILEHGSRMYALVEEMFPWCRSLTGEGTRKTLRRIQREIPEMTLHEVPSGTQVFDWTVPKEWEIREAWIEDEAGHRVVDFADSNLHVVGYSTPIDAMLTLEELQEHLYSIPEYPEWIPYVVSYYKERWGFCLADRARKALTPGLYHVHIESRLFNGSLTYGEVLIPGQTSEELFFSTYVCHPSMANNELSGPAVATELVRYIRALPNRRYSYRIVFLPETIGSIAYMAENLDAMQKNIRAGFNLSCLGDDRAWGYLPSREGNTLADRVALNMLRYSHPNYTRYSFRNRGSDERQYCSPLANLPVAVVTRSKYMDYPEYHTSADDMSLISPQGLHASYEAFVEIINALEHNHRYRVTCVGEPQLGKRGLYPTVSDMHNKEAYNITFHAMMDLIAYADGTHDLIEISDIIEAPVSLLIPLAEKMLAAGLFEIVDEGGIPHV